MAFTWIAFCYNTNHKPMGNIIRNSWIWSDGNISQHNFKKSDKHQMIISKHLHPKLSWKQNEKLIKTHFLCAIDLTRQNISSVPFSEFRLNNTLCFPSITFES